MSNKNKLTSEKYFAMKNLIYYYDFYKGNLKSDFDKLVDSLSNKLTNDDVSSLKHAFEEEKRHILNVLANSHIVYVKFNQIKGETIESDQFFDM